VIQGQWVQRSIARRSGALFEGGMDVIHVAPGVNVEDLPRYSRVD
jgi:hypothetical protein